MAKIEVIFKRRLNSPLRKAIEADVRLCGGVIDARFVHTRPDDLQVEYDQSIVSPRQLMEYVRQWEETTPPRPCGPALPECRR